MPEPTEKSKPQDHQSAARHPAACPHCGHDLSGVDSPTCPECGGPAAFKPAPTFGEAFRRLGPAGYLAVAWAILPAVGGILLLANLGPVSDWLVAHRDLGLVLYIGIFALSAGFGVLPTYSQAILGGWAFGIAVGFPAALAGFVGASMIGYLAARAASEDRAEKLIAENAKALAVREALIGHGFWKALGIVTLLRIPLNSPFALTNLVMASTGVSKRAFVIGTALGMAPRTFIAVWLATQVQNLTDDSIPKPLWLKIAGIASVIVVLAIVWWIGDRAVRKVTGAEPVKPETTEEPG